MQTPDFEAVVVVMLGSFNPVIFQPRWLGAQGLIRPEEAENPTSVLISSEITDFQTSWFQLQVLQNRLQLVSADPRQYPPLRDLALALFTLLPHTPVTAVGINRQFHFKMPTVEAWHALGHVLAPKDSWKEIMDEPGLVSTTIRGRRKDANGGMVNVKVEPSTRVPHGLYVEVNEEFQAPAKEKDKAKENEPAGAEWISKALAENWDPVLKFSEIACENLLSLVKK